MLIAVFITEIVILRKHGCISLLFIITCQAHADVIRLSVFLEFRQKRPNKF